MAERQLQIAGTERKKVPKKVLDKIDELRDAINAKTKATTKARDAELTAREAMKDAGIAHYIDTEASPPIEIDLRLTEKVVIKKHKADKAPKSEDGEGEK
jgi:hypothetical protein